MIERESRAVAGAAGCRRDRPLLGARRGPLGPDRGDRCRVRGAGRRRRRTPARRLQPPGLAGRAGAPCSRGPGRRAVLRTPADDVVPRAAARRAGGGQGPPLRLRQRRDRGLPRRAPGLELWVYSPLVQGSYDRADRPFPAAYDHPGTTARLAALASVASVAWRRALAGGAGLAAGARAGSRSSASARWSSSTPRWRRPRSSSRRRSSRRSTPRGKGHVLCSGQNRPRRIRWNRARRRAHARRHEPDAPNLAGLSAADRLLHQRIIVLGQEVDDAIANKLCAELLLLSAEDPRRDIALYINSPGGSVSAGLAIYDTMRLIPNDVATLAMGLAASMGQFLLSAGTPGKRFALPHSRILMHQGSAGIGGTAIDIEIQAENLEHTKNVMMRLIAEHTGQPVEKIEQDSRRDRWFTAEQARDYGFVDQVLADVAVRHADAAPAARRSGWGSRDEQLHDPERRREDRARRERAVDIYSRLLTDRIVYIGTEIDDGVANVVIAQLLHLESESPDVADRPLPQLPGRIGHRDARDLRHDAVHQLAGRHDVRSARRARRPRCCSRQATPGRRTVLPHSRVVLHQPSGGGQGTLPDLALHAKEIVRLRAQMEEILARHTGRDRRADPRGHRPRPGAVGAGGGGLRAGGRDPGQPQIDCWLALELNLTSSFMMDACLLPVAVITGASQGLGRALAHELASRGWSLVLDARHEAALHRGGPRAARRPAPGDRRRRRRPCPPPRPGRRGRRARRRHRPGQQRQHAGRQPAPDAGRPRHRDVPPHPAGQPGRARGADRSAAAPAPHPRRRGPQPVLGRVGRGLRDLGRLRLVEGRARPRDPGAGGRGAGAAGVRRRPGRHAHPDAPGRVPRRGHLRPAGADGRRTGAAPAAGRLAAERSLPRVRAADTELASA